MPQIEEFPAIEEFPTEDELRASLGGEGTPIPRSPEELAMQNFAARGGRSAGDVRPPGSGMIPEFRAPAGASLPVKVGAGILNTAGSVGNFFLSPEGVATMLAPEIVGPKIAAPVAKALFGGLMAKSAGEMAGKASVTGDAQDVTEAALAGLGAGLAGLHGSLPPKPEGFIGPIATGESLPMPRGSPAWRRPAFQLPDVPKFEETKPVEPEVTVVEAKKPEAEVVTAPPAEPHPATIVLQQASAGKAADAIEKAGGVVLSRSDQGVTVAMDTPEGLWGAMVTTTPDGKAASLATGHRIIADPAKYLQWFVDNRNIKLPDTLARKYGIEPPAAPTEAPPPVVEARPPEPAISEAATVGKGKQPWEKVLEAKAELEAESKRRSMIYQHDAKVDAADLLGVPQDSFLNLSYDKWSDLSKKLRAIKDAAESEYKGPGDTTLGNIWSDYLKAHPEKAAEVLADYPDLQPKAPQPSTPPPPIYKSIEGAKVEQPPPAAEGKGESKVVDVGGRPERLIAVNYRKPGDLAIRGAKRVGEKRFGGVKFWSIPESELANARALGATLNRELTSSLIQPTETPPPAAAKVQTEVAKPEGEVVEPKAPYSVSFESPSGGRETVTVSRVKFNDLPDQMKKLVENEMYHASQFEEWKDYAKWEKVKQGKTPITLWEKKGETETVHNISLDPPEVEFGRWATREDLYDKEFNPSGQSLRDKLIGEREAAEKAKQEKEAAERAATEKQMAAFREYEQEISKVKLPTGKKTTITIENKAGEKSQLSGTAYGPWMIDKRTGGVGKYAQPTVYKVTHIPSGLGISGEGMTSLEQAKNYVRALIHSGVRSDWKKPEDLSKAEHQALLEVARAWAAGGEVPKYFKAEPTPAPPAATGEGMPLKQSIGGAVPAEFEGNESFVSNMFAAIDRDRTELGLPPMEETIPRTWKAARAKAEAMLKTDPFWISELIARTNLEPRPMLDHEIVGTVLQRAKWKAELNEAWRRIGRATEDGHPELAKDDQLLAAQMLDKIKLLDKTVGRNGSASEAGRTLNAQKMALDDDLNLVSMVLKRQADTGKKVEPGSPKFEELKKIAEEYKRTSEALQADLNSKEARVSELNAKLALEAIEKEQLRKQIPDLSPKVLEVARKWVEKWDKEATQAMNNLLGKSWSPTPEMLLDLAKVARGNMAHLGLTFAEWSVKMTEKLGRGVEQFLQGAWDRALKMIDEEAGITEPIKRAIKKTASDVVKQADLTERLKAKLKDKRLDEITPLVQKLARTFSDQGVRGWRGIGDAVHGVLKELIPGLDYRDTLDAISGHGKFRLPDQAEGAKALRDAKSQMQEVRKIQEVIARQPVKPTGLKRDFPSDIKRRLTQIYENAKRKFGIVITDPATQLRSALQARKTYYEHRISDLQAEINSKKRIVKTKAPSPTDPALEKLIAEYKQVKAAHDEVFGPRELTDAERAAREEKSLDRQIAEVERQIKEGDIFPRTPGERPTSPAIESKRANLLALKSEREYLRESIQPTQYLTAEEKQLKAIKAGLARNIADKTARMARGDFTPKAKRPPPTLDAETLRLRAENQRVVKEYRRMAMKDELAKASPIQRAIAMALRLRRFEVLSGIHSIYKLASYSLQKLAGTPPEEALGAGLMKLPGLRTVGEKSTEVGYNTAKEIEYIKRGFTQGIRDAQQVWKRGESDLGAVYDPRIQKDVEWTGFFGRLHLMEKSVLLRTAFERAKDRLIEKAAAEGQPVSDEAVQLRIGIEAYNYAMQEILMNPNVLSKRVNRFLNSLEEKQKDTGRPRSSLTTLKTALELKLPIRNVPVNYIARTMDYVVGTEMGLSKLGMAFSRGIETLTPAEANAIKRHLTRGLVGKAVMALGFFNPNIFGGYYEPGEKRRKDEPKALTMQVYGHNIPTFLLHNPLLEAAQFGATIRRIADSKIRKRDQNTQGISSGVVGAVIGLLDETPYIRGMADYGKLRDPRQRGQALANEVRSLLIPQLLQNIAQDFDKDAQGERIIRRPQTFMQGIQVGIPGLRQQVPVSPKSSQAGGAIPSFVPTVQQR